MLPPRSPEQAVELLTGNGRYYAMIKTVLTMVYNVNGCFVYLFAYLEKPPTFYCDVGE